MNVKFFLSLFISSIVFAQTPEKRENCDQDLPNKDLEKLTSTISASNTSKLGELLFSHAVFSKGNVQAACSDFLGNVYAGGNVDLNNFLVNSPNKDPGVCPLSAKGDIIFSNGSISSGQTTTISNGSVVAAKNPDCVKGNMLYLQNVNVSERKFVSDTRFERLDEDLMNVSKKIEKIEASPDLEIYNFKSSEIKKDSYGKKNLIIPKNKKYVVIRSLEEEIDLSKIGLVFKPSGSIDPSRIIWDFPNAKKVKIFESGIYSTSNSKIKKLGIPGAIIAPEADITFENALVTGGIYSKSLQGGSLDESGEKCKIRSGQINYTPFDTSIFHSKKPCQGKGC